MTSMKSIKNIVLVTQDGTPQHDISPDVLTPDELAIFNEKGHLALPQGSGPLMDMLYLLKRMVDLQAFDTRTEQKRADEICAKLESDDGLILIEEADLNILVAIAEKFTPFLKGSGYNSFYQSLEDVEDV